MLNIAKEEAWFSRASFMLMGATEAAQYTIYNNKHEAPKLIKHNWRGLFSQGGLFCSQDSPCSQGRHSQVINVSVHKGWEVLLVSTGSCCLCLSGCWRVSSTNYRTQKWSEHDATGKQGRNMPKEEKEQISQRNPLSVTMSGVVPQAGNLPCPSTRNSCCKRNCVAFCQWNFVQKQADRAKWQRQQQNKRKNTTENTSHWARLPREAVQIPAIAALCFEK